MRRTILLFTLAFISFCVFAATKVSFADLQNGGWEQYKGQYVCISTPLVVCGTFYDSVYLAPERLFVPEERAIGLAEGDSTDYFRWVEHNRCLRVKVECPKSYNLNLGSTVKNLTALVTGVREMQTGRRPHFKNYKPQKKLPDFGKTDFIICLSNIQNYFVHQGGYATKRNTDGQHALQCLKVASALTKMKADLYAICELEKGDSAPAELAEKMNQLQKEKQYTFVSTNVKDGDTISVGFIYNEKLLQLTGPLQFAYSDKQSIYHSRFLLQGFKHIPTGEEFVVSLNHLRSKRGTQEESINKRNRNVDSLLNCIKQSYKSKSYTDPDILILGDFNTYTQEQPIYTIRQAGFEDMLIKYDSLNYSYSYKGECGYLDRIFATNSMAKQITGVKPVHWNTDYYYSAAYYSKYNFKKRIIPKDTPQNIKKYMSRAAKKNLLFRFSDHDPILIGVKLRATK